MNGYSNIPKKHISWQRESLKRFYKIQDWRKEINGIEDQSNYNALLDIDNYVDYCLDNKRYNDIVDIIKTNYGKLLWDLSQHDKWLKIVEKINCATHRDIKYIEALENICKNKQDNLFFALNQKIFI